MRRTVRAISSLITIESEYQRTVILERLENGEDFTYAPQVDPRKVPLIGLSLICIPSAYKSESPEIYLCILKKQGRITTGTVRVKGIDAIHLPDFELEEFLTKFGKRFRKPAREAFETPFVNLSEKLSGFFYDLLSEHYKDFAEEFERMLKKAKGRPLPTANSRDEDAAIEKDALGVCIDIFGADRSKIMRKWNIKEGKIGDSFLNGLDEYIAYEDDIISNDLHKIPGYNFIKESITGVVEFENSNGDRLCVINANRKPLEKAIGVDLIYFHRKYEAFTCIQYKMMDQKDAKSNWYYNPQQKSHKDELSRMLNLRELLYRHQGGNSLNDYRFTDCPIFFKLCKKLQLKEDDDSIATGAYISLDQWKMLLDDDSTKGRSGGTQIGYHTLAKRYLSKQSFIELVQRGMIGTRAKASEKLGFFIEAAIENGHSVMYAIEQQNAEEHPCV